MYLITTEEKCGGNVLREKIMYGKQSVVSELIQQTKHSHVESFIIFMI